MDLFDTVGYRSTQRPSVRDELDAHRLVSDGAPPEVQEDQLPFPLCRERVGEKPSDVMQGLLSARFEARGSQGGADGLYPA